MSFDFFIGKKKHVWTQNYSSMRRFLHTCQEKWKSPYVNRPLSIYSKAVQGCLMLLVLWAGKEPVFPVFNFRHVQQWGDHSHPLDRQSGISPWHSCTQVVTDGEEDRKNPWNRSVLCLLVRISHSMSEVTWSNTVNLADGTRWEVWLLFGIWVTAAGVIHWFRDGSHRLQELGHSLSQGGRN